MKIISFEGIDACGKETQAELIALWLAEQGNTVLHEAFPRYDKPIGAVIRKWLDKEIQLSDEAVHMLYEADRQDFTDLMEYFQSLETDKDHILVLDRFTLSNLAFGRAKGLDVEWLAKLQEKVPKPDITFLLDISPETSIKRRSKGRDRHEEDTELLRKTRNAYLQELHDNLVKKSLQQVLIIDGEQSVEEVHKQIKEYLKRTL